LDVNVQLDTLDIADRNAVLPDLAHRSPTPRLYVRSEESSSGLCLSTATLITFLVVAVIAVLGSVVAIVIFLQRREK
jgi:hypothetical protein